MYGSSGFFVSSYYMDVYCRNCLYEGEGEVFVDREVHSYYWDCPTCGHEYDGEGVPRMEGEG